MNAENTRRTEEAKRKSDENNMNIHNTDMSQEAPMMLVYIPIIDEHHGVMFANSSKQVNNTCFSHVLSDIKSHDDLLAHEVNDTETFAYKNQMAGSQWLKQFILIGAKQRKCFSMGKCMLNLNMMNVAT